MTWHMTWPVLGNKHKSDVRNGWKYNWVFKFLLLLVAETCCSLYGWVFLLLDTDLSGTNYAAWFAGTGFLKSLCAFSWILFSDNMYHEVSPRYLLFENKQASRRWNKDQFSLKKPSHSRTTKSWYFSVKLTALFFDGSNLF